MTLLALLRRLKSCFRSAKRSARIKKYLGSGQKPWTEGYSAYQNDYILAVLQNDDLMNRFRLNRELPEGYGFRLDERVIEYPWVLSRLHSQANRLLDAGGTLDRERLLGLSILDSKSIVVYTLAPTKQVVRGNVSYIYGDLRNTIIKDESLEEIVCISTLEHIGMDNTFIYTSDEHYRESKPQDYRLALQEFRRMLTPDGSLFITVPYGQYQNCGWLQQFDQRMVEDAIQTFEGKLIGLEFYRYDSRGWQKASAIACRDCTYFDIHQAQEYEPDYVPAARAVACIELAKA